CVERNLLCQLVDEEGPFWPRSHKTHFAAQDVESLRQFVDSILSDESTDLGSAIVVGLRPVRRPSTLGIQLHAAQFIEGKRASVPTDTFLPIEHRQPALQIDT